MLTNNLQTKVFKSEEYNYIFNRNNGFFARWGKTKDDDPEYSPFGPEILDIELSTICSRGCSFCYKSNSFKGKNMSFDTFRSIFDRFPSTLTQIAFGIGDIDANPDLWKIMEYCRGKGIIPNITISGERITSELFDKLADVCGAVAVSLYDKDTCYGAVVELTSRMEQVNIHCLLSEETWDLCMQALEDSINDPRLEGLNAIVFLQLKPKGRRNCFHSVKRGKFSALILFALSKEVSFGFDSCSAPNFLKVVKNHPRFEEFRTIVEPCESTLFSYYINVEGKGFPCSFLERVSGYKGTDVVGCSNFLKGVWNHEETRRFRYTITKNKDQQGCRVCPIYNLEVRDES